MNTFKRGDVVLWNGAKHEISYTDGPFVYFKGGQYAVEANRCTLVPQPKFKPGDKVKSNTVSEAGVGVVLDKDVGVGGKYSVKWNTWHGECRDHGDRLILVSSAPTLADVYRTMTGSTKPKLVPKSPTIVVRFENGSYAPNARPRVHDTVEAATKEAERLAKKEPGVAFATFVLASTSTATAPTVTTVLAEVEFAK